MLPENENFKMDQKLLNKTFLVSLPDHFGLPERFYSNLRHHGIDVTMLSTIDRDIKISIKNHIIHIYNKFFKNERNHKKKIRAEKIAEKQINFLTEKQTTYDYGLIIRPDLLHPDVVRAAKQCCERLVAYQWDGLNRYPKVFEYIDYFDDFYVFDKNDLKLHPKVKLSHNFYFDDLMETDAEPEKKIYYLGSLIENRKEILNKIKAYAKKIGIDVKFLLSNNQPQNKITPDDFGIEFLKRPLSFTENLLLAKNYFCFLDLQSSAHSGLSFRFFESIGFGRKIITNSKTAKEFDAYHPDNVFLLDDTNYEDLEKFLLTPYQPVDEKMREKYSFKNWLLTYIINSQTTEQ